MTKKKFDVPLVAEVEVVFRDVEATSAEEAEKLARQRWDSGDRPKDAAPLITSVEVGPAVELIVPKPYKPAKK